MHAPSFRLNGDLSMCCMNVLCAIKSVQNFTFAEHIDTADSSCSHATTPTELACPLVRPYESLSRPRHSLWFDFFGLLPGIFWRHF